MKRLVLFGAAALIVATLVPQETSAQRGGFRGAGDWPGDQDCDGLGGGDWDGASQSQPGSLPRASTVMATTMATATTMAMVPAATTA